MPQNAARFWREDVRSGILAAVLALATPEGEGIDGEEQSGACL
jgi:hypothetical protein